MAPETQERRPEKGTFAGEEGTLAGLVDGLVEHGERPALVQLLREDVRELSYATLAERVARASAGLHARGIERGETVALFARPGAAWVTACLALIRAGAVPVPLDTQLEDDDLAGVLGDCGARWILADARTAGRLEHVEHEARVLRLDGARVLRLDDEGEASDDEGETSAVERFGDWLAEAAAEERELPALEPDDGAVLFYTSGTTGPPKGVPLAHRHLAYQLDVVREADLVRPDDRMLLPLPLHHVYPFVLGVLAPLSLGLTIVLPRSLTGPQLLRAAEEGEATVMLGVPRIYRALLEGVERRIDSAGRLVGGALRAAIAACTAARRHLRLDAGRVLLGPLRRRLGPRLRMLVSGGAALDPDLAWTLEGLGFRVATGYGLTETSPLLTIVPPGSRDLETAGRAVRDTELRIDREAGDGEGDDPGDGDEGEIVVRGPGVFEGYRGLPEKTRESFTGDGWFRSGDLGRLDDAGRLHVSGRESTLIVTSSGEIVRTEEVEAAYARDERIDEIGILAAEDVEDDGEGEKGELVAVVVPARDAADGAEGEGGADEAVREALDARAESMPSYQRIARAVTSRKPLARTRLGKIRRHRLRERFESLAAGEGEGERERREPMPVEEMSGADQELLAHDEAREAWELLARRFGDEGLEPDTRLHADLGIDSLDWLDLGHEIAERTGIELEEERTAELESVRDLLEALVEGSPGESGATAPLEDPESALDEGQRRWLAPLPGPAARVARVVSHLNRALVRSVFRLEVRGAERVPENGPAVIAPNHASYLDPFVVAAALPEPVRARAFWGGWTGIAFRNPLFRAGSRLARVLPVDATRAAGSSLALAAAALERDGHLVWFPEGQRSDTGELREFLPGVGMLLEAWSDTPVVPVRIEGAHEAWPPGQRLPRPGRVRVTFGDPVKPSELVIDGADEEDAEARERIAGALRERVAKLGNGGA